MSDRRCGVCGASPADYTFALVSKMSTDLCLGCFEGMQAVREAGLEARRTKPRTAWLKTGLPSESGPPKPPEASAPRPLDPYREHRCRISSKAPDAEHPEQSGFGPPEFASALLTEAEKWGRYHLSIDPAPAQCDDPTGDDVAADAPRALDYLRRTP